MERQPNSIPGAVLSSPISVGFGENPVAHTMALLKCPKCSKPFYGLNCPTCDVPGVQNSRGKLVPLGCLICLGLFCFLIWTLFQSSTPPASYSPMPTAPSAAETRPAWSGTADGLYDAYTANEVAADERFKGKVVLFSGNIRSIGKDISDTPYIVVGGGALGGVQCLFPRSPKSPVASVARGQRVNVKGEVLGMSLGNVLVNECHLQ